MHAAALLPSCWRSSSSLWWCALWTTICGGGRTPRRSRATRALVESSSLSLVLSRLLSPFFISRTATAGFRPLELHPSAPVDTILSSFFAWQSQMVRSVADLGGCLPRALVWHADSGLGNRVQQFPTMVKYAALSSRVLVVDWPVRSPLSFSFSFFAAPHPTLPSWSDAQHPGTFDRYFEPLPTPMYRIEDLGPLLCKAQAYTARPPDKDVIRRDLIGVWGWGGGGVLAMPTGVVL